MSRRDAARLAHDALLLAVALATCAALALGAGLAALAPLAVGALVLALRGAPLRLLALALLALVLAVDNPQEVPAAGMWVSPLRPLGTLLFENLNKTLGVEALRFSALDVAVAALGLAALLRREPGAPSPTALRDALLLALLGLAGAEAWGLLRGGSFRDSLWQMHQPAFVALLALLFGRLLDARRDALPLGLVVVGAALFKALLGLYFYEVVCRPLNLKPAYTTTHSDSVLFVTAAVLLAGFALERRTRGSLALAGLALPVLGVGLLINNRRLAWVALAASALVIYALLPRAGLKRALSHLALAAVPALLLYAAAGWGSPSRLFRPVQMARSVLASDADRSTATRDIENYNLVWTLKSSPLLGVGFGHPYDEKNKADDISRFFAQYRFIPHNSLLGLWAFAGAVGASLAWLPLVLGLFFAARSYRWATTALERTTALTAVAACVAYAVQGYGDMGLQSWPATFLLAVALATSGQLAVAVGAWPTPAPARTPEPVGAGVKELQLPGGAS